MKIYSKEIKKKIVLSTLYHPLNDERYFRLVSQGEVGWKVKGGKFERQHSQNVDSV